MLRIQSADLNLINLRIKHKLRVHSYETHTIAKLKMPVSMLCHTESKSNKNRSFHTLPL